MSEEKEVLYLDEGKKIYREKTYKDKEGKNIYLETANGNKFWYKNGKLNGPAGGPAVVRANGTMIWYLNDKIHREDGPAIVFPNGDRFWLINGKKIKEQNNEN